MRHVLTILFSLILFCGHAQYDTIYVSVKPFTVSSGAQGFANLARNNVIQIIDQNYKVSRVDQDFVAASAVEEEKEYQKSEEFIDGKIVEQDQGIRADYEVQGNYDHRSKKLTLSIYDVNTGKLKGSVVADKVLEIKKVKRKGWINLTLDIDLVSGDKRPTSNYKGLKGSYPSPNAIKTNTIALLEKSFPDKGWAVVRPTSENSSKIKEVLIAAGRRMGLTRKTYIEFLVIQEEEVDGVSSIRLESAGWGKVTKVEGENFSIVKIGAGERNIKKLLDEGKEIRCRFLKN